MMSVRNSVPPGSRPDQSLKQLAKVLYNSTLIFNVLLHFLSSPLSLHVGFVRPVDNTHNHATYSNPPECLAAESSG